MCHPIWVRYSQPRKLKTKRGQLKAERNAWCIKCHQPMAKHGCFFHCQNCRSCCKAQQGPPQWKRLAAPTNPWCLRCRQPLIKHGQSYRCKECGTHVADNHRLRLALERRGRTNAWCLSCRWPMLATGVWRCERCGVSTVYHSIKAERRDTRPEADPRNPYCIIHRRRMQSAEKGRRRFRCPECRLSVTARSRQMAHYVGVQWQLRPLAAPSTTIDRFVRAIDHAVPRGLLPEMREEICQEMLLAILDYAEKVVLDVPGFVKAYKKRYPLPMNSLDANPLWAEKLVG